MSESIKSAQPMQGPAPAPRPRGPYDFSRFDRLMADLQRWRNADHENGIFLRRNFVIEIIEGVEALRRPRDEQRRSE